MVDIQKDNTMNIQGTNVTKEQLEASQRLGDALIAVAKVVYPETNAAISALVGCGVGILVDYTNGDVIETRRIIDNMIEMIVESRDKSLNITY